MIDEDRLEGEKLQPRHVAVVSCQAREKVQRIAAKWTEQRLQEARRRTWRETLGRDRTHESMLCRAVGRVNAKTPAMFRAGARRQHGTRRCGNPQRSGRIPRHRAERTPTM